MEPKPESSTDTLADTAISEACGASRGHHQRLKQIDSTNPQQRLPEMV